MLFKVEFIMKRLYANKGVYVCVRGCCHFIKNANFKQNLRRSLYKGAITQFKRPSTSTSTSLFFTRERRMMEASELR